MRQTLSRADDFKSKCFQKKAVSYCGYAN